MPITVERYPNLPVLVFTYSGAITLQHMIDSYQKSLSLLTPDDQLIYRVVHVDSLESNFAEIIKIAQARSSTAATAAQAPTQGPQMILVIVGHDKWTKLYLQIMSQQQFGGVSIPCFLTVDQAIQYIRGQLNEQAS